MTVIGVGVLLQTLIKENLWSTICVYIVAPFKVDLSSGLKIKLWLASKSVFKCTASLLTKYAGRRDLCFIYTTA